MSQDTMRPIFVIGAPRSGTTAVVLGLRIGAGLPGYDEGHALPLLNQLHQTVDDYFASLDNRILEVKDKQLIGAINAEEMKAHITAKFVQAIEERLGSGVWVDKTPGDRMIEAVPRLATIFPHARFVFAKRRGIENVLSRSRKFPGHRFEAQCTFWAECMTAWLRVRRELPKERYIEIDQHDIALYPEATARRLGAFLELSPDQSNGIHKTWRSERPQQSRTAQDYRYIGLDETGWSEEEQATFVRICGSVMKAFGYDLEGRLFQEACTQPVYLYYPVAGAVEEEVSTQHIRQDGFHQFGRGFLLHPNWPGKSPAVVRYRNMKFFGHNHFSASLFLNHPDSEPVEYRIMIEQAESGLPIFEEYIEVCSVRNVEWNISLPTLEGAYNIVVSTTMSADAETNHKAWAIWKEPYFSVRNHATVRKSA